MKVDAASARIEPERRPTVDAEAEAAFAQLLGGVQPQETGQRPAARDLSLGWDDAPTEEAEDTSEDTNADALDAGGEAADAADLLGMAEGVTETAEASRAERWLGGTGPQRSIFARAVDGQPGGSATRAVALQGRAGAGPNASAPTEGVAAPPAPFTAAPGLGSSDGTAGDPARGGTSSVAAPSLATVDLDAAPADEVARAPMAAVGPPEPPEPEPRSAPTPRAPLSAPMTVSLQLATLAHDVIARVQAPDAPPPTFTATSAPKPLAPSTATGQDAFIHIDHPDLGRIRLQLQIEARSLRVRAIAQSVAAAAALRDSEEDMRADVARHGVDLARLRVDVEDRRRRGEG